MPLHFTLVDKGQNEENITNDGLSYILKYPCKDNRVECTSYYSMFQPGNYIFEVWGAQGGFNGGHGGYSFGLITLTSRTPVYITIGSEGDEIDSKNGFTTAAFNGGGIGHSDHSSEYSRSAGSGGGATDIKFNYNTNMHRALVAGGGGGRAEAEGYNGDPGYGEAK